MLTLHVQKKHAAPVYPHHAPLQEVTMDCLGAGIGAYMHLVVANVAGACSGNAGGIFVFSRLVFGEGGALGCCLFVPVEAMLPEGLKK